ncbi:porin [Paraburkholderia flava]|uniref:porin n=1 Tax=Paraburkholderia flava TaxID=2547393 RepID=UPI00105BCE08|nr:porin [Paraburkholderia flava]
MKSRLIRLSLPAAATLLIAAPAAHAQSSVTLYGIVDVGIEAVNHVPTSSKGSGTVVREASGNLSGSRWGFRGVEDLGGGLKAIFVLENGFNVNTGTLGQSGREFGRQAYVGLQGRYGTVTLGRQQNLLYDMIIRYDPMRFGSSYSAIAHDAVLTGRADNSAKYMVEFSGVTLAAMYSNGYDSTITGGAQVPGHTKVGREYGAGARYAAGPFDVALVYDQRQGTSIASADDTARRLSIGASYKFAKTELYAAWRLLQQTVGAAQTHANLFWLGATQHFTPALQVSAVAYHTDVRGTGQDPTSYVLSLDYYLSKRTDLYVNASYAQNRDGSNLGIDGIGTNIVAGENQLGAVAGIRHRF